MEIDILTVSILIGLFLTNVILIFLNSRQQSTFRQTEKRLRDTLLEKIKEVERQQSTFRQTETRLRDTLLEKIEEVEHLLRQYARQHYSIISPLGGKTTRGYIDMCGAGSAKNVNSR